MRTVTYTCDRCGKQVSARNVTKMNIVLYRGLDSTEKKSCDFCSPCFLKMKKAWKSVLSCADDTSVKPEETPAAIDELAVTQAPVLSEGDKIEEKPIPKKRGRKPKPVNPEDWLNRTELAHGVIKPPEKAFILKLYVENNLTPDEIAEKLHRVPKGINRTINAAIKSGEIDKLKAEHEKTNDVYTASMPEGRSSYIMPSNTEIIDGEKYDVGGIMALHKAGWQPSEIADEKNYDEDLVRVIIENHKDR